MIDELKNIEYVLFDLDGTVSDSSEGITKSADKALKSEGIDVPFETLTSFIGPALRVSFGRYTETWKNATECWTFIVKDTAKRAGAKTRFIPAWRNFYAIFKKAGNTSCLQARNPSIFAEKS